MTDKWELMCKEANSDRFINLPLETQALYFHLASHADEDGNISAPKAIMRSIKAHDDSLKQLMDNGLIFDCGIAEGWGVSIFPRISEKIEDMLEREEHGE